MTNVQNSFDILNNIEETSKSKKKRDKKKKAKEAQKEEQSAVQAPTVEQSVEQTLAVLKRGSNVSGKTNQSNKQQGQLSSQIQDLRVVKQQWELSAQQNDSGDRRLNLWQKWFQQATVSGKAMYRTDEGTNVNFKQAILQTSALETTVETVVQNPVDDQGLQQLETLLSTFLPANTQQAQPLIASTIADLGHALQGADPEVVAKGKLAVFQLILAIKLADSSTGGSSTSKQGKPSKRTTELEREVYQRDQRLTKLEAAADNRNSKHLAERCKLAQELAMLAEERVLLTANQSTGIAHSGINNSGIKQVHVTLSDLQSLIQQRVIGSGGARQGGGGRKQQSLATRKQQVDRDYQVKLTELGQEEQSLRQTIQQLEMDLVVANSQLDSVLQQTRQLKQTHNATIDAMLLQGSKGSVQSSDSQAQMRAAISLQHILDDCPGLALPADAMLHGGSDSNTTNDQVMSANAYVNSVSRFLSAVLVAMKELAVQCRSRKQKLANSTRLAEQASKLAASTKGASSGDIVQQALKQKEDFTKQIEETVQQSRDLLSQCRTLSQQLYSQVDLLNCVPGSEMRQSTINEVPSVILQIEQAHQLVMKEYAGGEQELTSANAVRTPAQVESLLQKAGARGKAAGKGKGQPSKEGMPDIANV